MTQKLSPQQQSLLTAAQSVGVLRHTDGSMSRFRILVVGHSYRTAIALEKRGLGRVRHQGPNRGWFRANLIATADELVDAQQAEEDVPLVIDGRLTEAGEIYVLDERSKTLSK